jgi:hypothetical protein
LKMTRNSFAAVFAVALTALWTPAATQADPADPADAAAALASNATNAGTAAGIVSQCHSDSSPIRAAFMRALDEARVDDAMRQSLWQRYRSAETSTIIALANQPEAGCADTNGIIRHTIHRLEMPES